ncbi:RNA polymerase sigma factor region1.1 domain-containing protein [Mesorhizobium sp. ArgA1]
MSEYPGLPEHIRNAILVLIDRYRERGSITLDEVNFGLPHDYGWASADIENVFELITAGGLRIEE